MRIATFSSSPSMWRKNVWIPIKYLFWILSVVEKIRKTLRQFNWLKFVKWLFCSILPGQVIHVPRSWIWILNSDIHILLTFNMMLEASSSSSTSSTSSLNKHNLKVFFLRNRSNQSNSKSSSITALELALMIEMSWNCLLRYCKLRNGVLRTTYCVMTWHSIFSFISPLPEKCVTDQLYTISQL